MSTKRKDLGFDESSDGEQDVVIPKINLQRKLKLPKLPLEHDIEDERPALGTKDELHNAPDVSIDYLSMTIHEDDSSRPQKLHDKDHGVGSTTVQKTQAELTKERLNRSLFGMVRSTDNAGSDVLKSLPNEQVTSSKSKGLSMMEKMGFKIGDTLGKDQHNKNALLEPILLVANSKRSGLRETEGTYTHIPELKEKDADEFRNRLREEKLEAKLTKTMHQMQKYCYEFSGDADSDITKLKPLDINVLWRGYIKHIQKLLKEKEVRHMESQEESMTEIKNASEFSDDSDQSSDEDIEEDFELQVFEELPLADKVQRLNLHLRSEYDYCFYCGVKYADQKDLFESCPGDSEEDHV
jgi:RNA polymerase-binding transcription factor DksA